MSCIVRRLKRSCGSRQNDGRVVAWRNMMKAWSLIMVFLVVVGIAACAKKAKPLVPLALDYGTTPQAVTLTEQGTQAYQARQFEQAKQYFSQAVTAAPQSGQAHYN